MTLSDLTNRQTAFVSTIDGSPSLRIRLEELGFVPGQEVTRVYATPGGTPIIFSMLGQRVALRSSEAALIHVDCTRPEENYGDERRVAKHPATDAPATGMDSLSAATYADCHGCPGCGSTHQLGEKREGTITIALIGNPNCGKTTVFNAVSGGHERTGNYAGVTVSSAMGETTFEGRTLRFIDLPGTYSLKAYSPEEAYVMSELRKGNIDVVINVLDVNNLERNLLLTLQVFPWWARSISMTNLKKAVRPSTPSVSPNTWGFPLSPVWPVADRDSKK